MTLNDGVNYRYLGRTKKTLCKYLNKQGVSLDGPCIQPARIIKTKQNNYI